MKKRDVSMTHVRHDVAHCLAPGLFRSIPKGERKKAKLDLTYEFGDDQTVRFIGFEPLGVDDMLFLQALVASAGPDGILLTPEPSTKTGQKLRALLDPQLDALKQDALIVRESLPKILSEVGMTDGGENIKSLKESLVRMSNVTVIAKNGRRQASFHLMSHAFDEETGKLWVALNPRIAESVLGRSSFVRIQMAEVRALQSDPARLIHQRLCGWIDPGKSGRIELDTLCGYIWPDPATDEAMKKRRQAARKAVAELIAVGWTVEEYSKGKWRIERPKT